MSREELVLRKKSPVQIRNRKASFEYFFINAHTAGIVPMGTEVKPIRLGKASLVDIFCYICHDEIWIKGMSISPYFCGSYSNLEARRDCKLLLTKRKIRKLEANLKVAGHTVIPTLVFIGAHGRAKMDIALARGKRGYDKQQTLKEKEDRREMDRAIKNF